MLRQKAYCGYEKGKIFIVFCLYSVSLALRERMK